MTKVNTSLETLPADPYAVWYICERCEWTGPRQLMRSTHIYPDKYKNCCPDCGRNEMKTLVQLQVREAVAKQDLAAWKLKPLHVQAEFSNALEARLLRIQRLMSKLSWDEQVNKSDDCKGSSFHFYNHQGFCVFCDQAAPVTESVNA